jgi:hypothetical protein
MVPTSLSERRSSVFGERSASRDLCGNDKGDMGRVKRELQLDLRTGNETKQVYTSDLSQRGVKVGGQMLRHTVGGRIEFALDAGGRRYFLPASWPAITVHSGSTGSDGMRTPYL